MCVVCVFLSVLFLFLIKHKTKQNTTVAWYGIKTIHCPTLLEVNIREKNEEKTPSRLKCVVCVNSNISPPPPSFFSTSFVLLGSLFLSRRFVSFVSLSHKEREEREERRKREKEKTAAAVAAAGRGGEEEERRRREGVSFVCAWVMVHGVSVVCSRFSFLFFLFFIHTTGQSFRFCSYSDFGW